MTVHDLSGATRRAVLAGLGAVGVGATVSGSATAHEDDSNGDDSGDDHQQGGELQFPPSHLTERGSPVSVGNGEARAFVSHNSAGQPMFVGVQFTAAALEGLGDEHVPHSLSFPDSAGETPFEWVAFDWGPEGHGPPGVYDVPHFDVHFYMLSESAVGDIPAINFPPGEGEPYSVSIPEDQFPPNYFRERAVVPQMGEHLVNAAAPEWSGGEFSNTFIWGHWDGNLHFFEPMVTTEYLAGLEGHDTRAISTPSRMPEAGHYPTEYTVRYHEAADAYTVTLESFRSFEASQGAQN